MRRILFIIYFSIPKYSVLINKKNDDTCGFLPEVSSESGDENYCFI